jgi:hypothetical protein
MGRSISLVPEINRRTVVFTCFGEPYPFDDIAMILHRIEVEAPLSISDSDQGLKQYQDTETDVTNDIPGNWIISGIIPGQRVTLQSFPKNKYIDEETLESGKTKYDLFIRNDICTDDFVSQMKSNEAVIILTEEEIVPHSGRTGTKIELESMARSTLVVTEINERVVILTCFGDVASFDERAVYAKSQ